MTGSKYTGSVNFVYTGVPEFISKASFYLFLNVLRSSQIIVNVLVCYFVLVYENLYKGMLPVLRI